MSSFGGFFEKSLALPRNTIKAAGTHFESNKLVNGAKHSPPGSESADCDGGSKVPIFKVMLG